jgi:hypothetical protein
MRIVFALAMLLGLSTPVSAQSFDCSIFDGAIIINSDDEYLGKIANKFDSDSIFNKYGSFGSKYGSDSIWNKYGTNGSEYSVDSAFNRFSSDPPKIIKDRQIIGYLTVNKQVRGGISPLLLGALCYDFEPPR